MIEVEKTHFKNPLIEEDDVLAQQPQLVHGHPFDKPPSISIYKILCLLGLYMNAIFMRIYFGIKKKVVVQLVIR
jgi:hypothetical protein